MSLLQEQRPTEIHLPFDDETLDSAAVTDENPVTIVQVAKPDTEYSFPKGFTPIDGDFLDTQTVARLASVKEALQKETDERVFTLTDIETESVNTLARAVELFGPKVAEQEHLPEAELTGVIEEVRAVQRMANSLGRTALVPAKEPSSADTKAALVERREYADIRDLSALPAASQTTESHLKFIANSLDVMRSQAGDVGEKMAANQALELLVEDPEKALIVVEAVRPEKALLVRLAKLIGEKAVRYTAKKAVVKPRLAVRS